MATAAPANPAPAAAAPPPSPAVRTRPASRWERTAVDVCAGLAAGVNVTLVGHPFETIKVRLQTQPSGANALYSGFLDAVRKTVQWEGLGGLYAGVGAPLMGQLFFRSLMFWANSTISAVLSDEGRRPMSYFDYGLAGALAWGTSTLIECPLQVMSSQLQVEGMRQKTIPGYTRKYQGVFDFLRKEVRTRGAGVLYTGVLPHLTRNIPGGFFHFGLFEVSRREYAKFRGVRVEEIGLLANMVAGSIGGFFFWFLTYPADVVKSAIQGDSLDPASRKYHGMLDAYRKLWAEGGAGRFTKGLSACLLRSLPANAVLLTTAFRVKEIGYGYIERR